MRSQHDRSLLSGRHGHNLDLPCVWSHGVGDVADNLSGETLLAIWINDREGDRVLGVCNNGEIAVIPTIWSTMKSVVVVVLVRENIVLHAIDLKCAVLDAVGVTAGDTTEMRMHLTFILICLVETKHNIALYTVLASDEEIRDRRAVRDEESTNAFGRDLVLAVRVGSKRAVCRCAVLCDGRRGEDRKDGRGPHLALVSREWSEKWS